MLKTASSKKRVVGLLLFAAILVLFVSLNRFPKLDAVGGDLDVVTAPEVQCFQGFCIERDPGTTFVSRWWVFSVSYLRLVAIGMVFAFVVAGLAECSRLAATGAIRLGAYSSGRSRALSPVR